MLDTILLKRFEKLPGRKKVMRREYAIEESVTGKEFDRKREWALCFRPGQKVGMSMLFDSNPVLEVSCPRCKTGIRTPAGFWATWYVDKIYLNYNIRNLCWLSTWFSVNPHCRMDFRQITKVTHRIQSAERLQTTVRSADGTPIHVNIPLFPPTLSPTRASIYAENIPQRWEPEQKDDPADFQRVQLVRQLLESIEERAIKDGGRQMSPPNRVFSFTRPIASLNLRLFTPTMESQWYFRALLWNSILNYRICDGMSWPPSVNAKDSLGRLWFEANDEWKTDSVVKRLSICWEEGKIRRFQAFVQPSDHGELQYGSGSS